MIDPRATVEAEARAAVGAAQAAGHRAGVDHEVVVGAVEPVGDEQLELLPHRVALRVAGDHAEVGGGDEVGVVQQPGQRRAGHHRLQPGQGARVGALLDHREQEVEAVGEQAAAERAPGEEVEHRQPAVEAAGGERGAARRACGAHEAGDADLALDQQLDELGERRAVGIVGVVARLRLLGRQRLQAELLGDRAVGGEQGVQALGVEQAAHALALSEAEQLADQAAARVADQVQLGVLRQAARERERVRDRALGEAAVFEGEDALAVGGSETGAGGRAGGVARIPQLAEAALAARRGAVQEDQQRPAAGQLGVRRERRQREAVGEAHAVQAGGLRLELALLEVLAELARGALLDAHAEELEHAHAQPEQAALGRGRIGRGSQRVDLPGVAAVAGAAAAAVLAYQGVGAGPQHEAVVELDADHLVAGDLEFAAHAVARPPGDQRAPGGDRDQAVIGRCSG